ncbi:MAG: hypothetical protein R2851_26310 [Caldilineaceae bacterium]
MFKQLSFAAVLGFTAVMTWQILARMSMDAVAMAMGIVLGIGAGVPVALLFLAAERRGRPGATVRGAMMAGPTGHGGYGQQPPVVVIARRVRRQGHQPALTAQQYGMPVNPSPRQRRFVVVGQGDEGIEEW